MQEGDQKKESLSGTSAIPDIDPLSFTNQVVKCRLQSPDFTHFG
jgi:hypothetical protein